MSMPDVEDFYPLSPLQQGLLFHSLSDEGDGLYFNQTLLGLEGALDVEAFRRAWAAVVDLHPILRTFFVWEGVEKPIQVVKRGATMPLDHLDWRADPAGAHAQRLDSLLQEDLAQGFDLSQAPLMRATLVRTADDRHELSWSFHHLLMDGWSMFRMLGQVFATYDTLVAGGSPQLERSRPYRDYLVWLSRQDRSKAEAFWRENLAGFTAPTPLPPDLAPDLHAARGPAQTAAESADFAVLTGALSVDTTAALSQLAADNHLTLNTLLQGAWALLLSRYSRESDVLFGAIVSGRPPELEGVDGMVGLFINSLPVRVRMDRSEALLPWLQRLQADQAELREYEHSALVDVQGWSEVPRGEQLFETLFLFENYRKDTPLEEMCSSLKLRDVRWFERHNFPIAAVAIPGESLSLRVIYQTQRFSRAGIERLLGHWRTLVESMVAQPGATLGAHGLLTPEERKLLLETWNDTDADLPDVCAHELVERQADALPESLAVVQGERCLTYAELELRANRLAHQLKALGVGPGVRVALATGRTLEMVVGILGTLKAGGAYVACDLGVPPARLAYVFEDSQALVVLTTAETASSLPAHGAQTLTADAQGQWRADAAAQTEAPAWPATRPAPSACPSDLAYVIYTSGSTGTPKGVELEHAGLVNLLSWHQRTYDVKPGDRASHLAGLGFDACVWELWPYLAAGSCLHLVDQETRLAPDALLQFFARVGITQAFVPTPLAEAMLRLDMPSDLVLDVVFTGGDKLNRAPEQALPFRLVNHYGPTENTVVATAVEVPPNAEDDSAPTIGKPIDNVQCYLLDADMNPVPVGVAGELFIGGKSLARGYLGREDLTAQAFVPNPFRDDTRLYATGDLGCWTGDGEIEFLGRIDSQVKVRGYRIELGEIETVLARHAGVREAVVLAREDVPGNKQLAGYVVAADPAAAALQEAELKAHCAAELPDYMVPPAILVLDSFPLSSSGKLDRKALPAPDIARPRMEAAYEAPTEGVEATIANIWRESLKLDQVGRADNFFDLGGNSILLIAVHGKLKAALGREFPMVELFRFPTVGTLARHLEGAGDPSGESPQDAAEKTEKLQAGRSRLAQMQQRRRRK